MQKKIYKPGQGKYTRLCSGFVVALVAAFGSWRLWQILEATDVSLWVVAMVPVALFVALAVTAFWLVNKPALADFLIAAEGELKKVNWSSRQEIVVSTVVVIVVLVGMAALLGVTDVVFRMIFSRLLLPQG